MRSFAEAAGGKVADMEQRRAEQLALGVGIAMLSGAPFWPLRRLVARCRSCFTDLDELTKDQLYRRLRRPTSRPLEMTKDELSSR